MEVLSFFSSCYQEIDSWSTNHEPLIPNLYVTAIKLISWIFFHYFLN